MDWHRCFSKVFSFFGRTFWKVNQNHLNNKINPNHCCPTACPLQWVDTDGCRVWRNAYRVKNELRLRWEMVGQLSVNVWLTGVLLDRWDWIQDCKGCEATQGKYHYTPDIEVQIYADDIQNVFRGSAAEKQLCAVVKTVLLDLQQWKGTCHKDGVSPPRTGTQNIFSSSWTKFQMEAEW